jgi:NADH-quinone oxidoreductase subunit M
MINHGLSTGALFLLVGMLYERIHTRELAKMGGLGAVVPVYAGVFLFVALSSIGLPGLNGFVGEFLIILGTFIVGKAFAVAAVTGVVLSAVYLLWGYQRAMLGPLPISGGATNSYGNGSNGGRSALGRLKDLELREYFIIVPIMAAILFIGMYPKPLLSRIEPTANNTLNCVQQLNGRGPIPGLNPASRGVQPSALCQLAYFPKRSP